MYYKIEVSDEANQDIYKLTKYLQEFKYNMNKVVRKLNEDIDNLIFMPRAHKTLISSKNPDGEYRRMISGKYIVIYQIEKEQINILRVFSEKQNYLNSKNFILKEESQKYKVNKRRKKIMLKLKTLKNSYLNLKENFTHTITEEEIEERYLSKILDETIENIKNEGVFYTEEEFWKIVEEMEIEEYGEPISYNIRKKYE